MLEAASCMYVTRKYQMLKVSKEIKKYSKKYIKLHLRCLFLMLKVSKVLYTYINRMKPLPHYVHTDKVLYCSGFFII